MSFVDQKGAENRKTAIIGAGAVNAAIGTVLILGLSTVVTKEPPAPPMGGIEFPTKPPPPPPEPETKPDEKVVTPQSPPIYTPPISNPLKKDTTDLTTTTKLPIDTGEISKTVLPSGTKTVIEELPDLPVLADPVGAKPRNRPGDWVSDRDYKRSWIRQELTGIARFKLTIGTDGRVQDCQITASTGHTELDRATCSLVTKRAKFNPAFNALKEKVPGTYNSAIKWDLPD